MTFLAFHAFDTAHAIVVTLVRLVVTKRKMLEWETAATTAARAAGVVGQGLRRFVVEMAASPIIAAAVTLDPRGAGTGRASRGGAVSRLMDDRAGHGLLAQRAGGRTRPAAQRSRPDRAAANGAQDVALLRNVRH